MKERSSICDEVCLQLDIYWVQTLAGTLPTASLTLHHCTEDRARNPKTKARAEVSEQPLYASISIL